MNKKILLTFVFAMLLIPAVVFAQMADNVFEARVTKVLEQKTSYDLDGRETIQQNLELQGIEGDWKGTKVVFYGISDFEVISANVYKKGDRVLVNYAQDADGNNVFFVLDYVRRNNIYFLAFIFALAVVLVGGWKGFRSLLSLGLSFFIIMKFIIPLIMSGYSPILVAIAGSFFILLFIVYLTEGWCKKSHLSVVSILIALLITGGLSIVFTYFARLTGRGEEEVMYLMGIGKGFIDFKGLLLAGIMIGTLGVLDDMVISQVEAVRQIKESIPKISKKELIKKATEIGKSHLGAIINTLFLAYAAVSLPFLLLFSAKSMVTFSQVINNELIATEIIRTLVGSIGIVFALPISTIIAAHYYAKTKKM